MLLAQTWRGEDVRGWYLSEKIDGMRAYWDGGATRGISVYDIPWAGKNGVKTCTGLWSRYNTPIPAPDWWLDELPDKLTLDGELFCGNFQQLMSIVKRFSPGPEWELVEYKVFDSPKLGKNFQDTYSFLLGQEWNNTCKLLEQVKCTSKAMYDEMFRTIVERDGEGVMARHPGSFWEPKRSKFLLKRKGILDGEGVIVGFKPGKGRLEGMVGALVVRWRSGIEFDLSGMDDSERVWGYFNIGDEVKFSYRCLSNGGVPKEARYICIVQK
jgi:DNA ligase-1